MFIHSIQKVIVLLFVLVSSETLEAGNNIGLGIMIGANSAVNQFEVKAPIQSFDSKLGYNANAFLRLKFAGFIIQPEVGYFYNRASFILSEGAKNIDVTLNLGEVYASTVFGFKIGTLRFMGGPLAYTNSSENFSNLTTTEASVTSLITNPAIKWGGQLGLGLDISKKWCIDARFQKLLTSNSYRSTTPSLSDNFNGTLGSLSLSIGYSFIKM